MLKNLELSGKIHPSIVNEDVFAFEINIDKLLELKTGKPKYKEISKFPSIKKDIALVVDKNVEAIALAKVIKKACGNNLKDIEIFDVYEGKGIEDGKKSLAYSLTFSSQDKTLTDDEINPLFEKIIVAAGKEFGGMLRQ